MKRLPVLQETPAWRSLDERRRGGSEATTVPPLDATDASVSRRSFLQLMGASVALGSLAGCRRPAEHIYPYGRAPEEVVPGRPERYATAFGHGGTALGVLVESHEGRPTKIEGNPQHPESLGAASAFAQAAVLDLYDPARSRTPLERGQPRSWSEALASLRSAAADLGEGKGLLVITEAHRSAALATQLEALRARWPGARILRHEPLGEEVVRAGCALAFGRRLDPIYTLAAADVLVALDSDLLQSEGSSIKHARAFAERRREHDKLNRLYAIEARFSVTGAAADHRLRAPRGRIHALALGLARALGRPIAAVLPDPGPLDATEQRFVEAAARDLLRAGPRGLVVAGLGQPAPVHALAQLVNHALGAVGTTVRYVAPFSEDREGPDALAEATTAMRAGEIRLAVLLGTNPVYDAPAALGFAEALAKVPVSVHLSGWVDETSQASTLHLPAAHWLEAWGDVRAADGTWSVAQPLIAPLHGGRSALEIVEALLGGARGGYTIVSDALRARLGARLSAAALRRALHDGLLAGSAWAAESVQPRATALAAPAALAGLEVTFDSDAHAHDGRFAGNAWLQELPDPMTKLTWGNAALVSPRTATRLGLADGDVVELALERARVSVPVLRAPGQADDSIALTVGLGRRAGALVGVGVDVGALRPGGAGFVQGATLRRTGARERLALTQEHDRMEGRPLVRETTPSGGGEEPSAEAEHLHHEAEEARLWEAQRYDGHRWGMVIDLSACLGCGACTVACQAENNIPVVGRDGVLRSREMHWIRVDRYYTGDEDAPQAVMQPIGCQHCEQAPCEQVCPVGATTHSPEGLNDMAYNRCVGTRYCANNCPYKVRRYNFYNYNREVVELRKMQLNPDVTVRARGVMEKCSYCVQRINGAKIAAHLAGRDRVEDGAVLAACQQTCPTQAISFGDLNDPKSVVAQRAKDPRRYGLLEELDVRPRTSFLARVRNPNPELA